MDFVLDSGAEESDKGRDIKLNAIIKKIMDNFETRIHIIFNSFNTKHAIFDVMS